MFLTISLPSPVHWRVSLELKCKSNIWVCFWHTCILVRAPFSKTIQHFPFLVLCVKVKTLHSGHVVEEPKINLTAMRGPGAKLKLAFLSLLWPQPEANLAECPELGRRNP